MNIKKLLLTAASGVISGIAIGMAGMAYLATEEKLAGAVLFSVALLTICSYGTRLFTGSIGYLLTDSKAPWTGRLLTAVAIWLGNLVGTGLCGAVVYFMRAPLRVKAAAMAAQKLEQPVTTVFVLAIFCGLLMYLAVDIYRTRTGFYQLAGIFIAVPVFIMAGFEHSIADMFFLSAGNGLAIDSFHSVMFFVAATLGNAAGSVILPLAGRIVTAENRT